MNQRENTTISNVIELASYRAETWRDLLPIFNAARNGMAMKRATNDAELDEGLDMEQIR